MPTQDRAMKRFYHSVILEHLQQHHEMVFLMGPRQVGKTTTSKGLMSHWPSAYYFNWDNPEDRRFIVQGPDHVARKVGLPTITEQPTLLIFDEIHKFSHWKLFLKGFYDTYSPHCRIVVTGSARLDVYKKGGDSLMGRYFKYHFHPLTVGELLHPTTVDTEIRKPTELANNEFLSLFQYGGYPAPFLNRTDRYATRWRSLRLQQLVHEDIRDLTRVHEMGQLEVAMELLTLQAGQLLNFSSLALKLGVNGKTIKSWIEVFKSLYYCYTILPWTKRISRSLTKTPKVYLWDWTLCKDIGAQAENFVASHLLKAVHFWTDHGFGNFSLHYLRDKQQREVDFLVAKDNEPWFLVEVRTTNNKHISKQLYYFQEQTQAQHAFQVILDFPYVNADCFARTDPVMVPARTFLSQLI